MKSKQLAKTGLIIIRIITTFMIVIFSGCAQIHTPHIVYLPDMSVSAFEYSFGSPHIDNGFHRYYMGGGETAGIFTIIEYDGDTITHVSHHRYDERTLYLYVPKLIQSLKHKDANIAYRALSFLTFLMHQLWPNGYHEKYYMTEDMYKDTPFEKYPPTWTKNSYQEWLNWWKKHGRKDFDKMRIWQ